MLASRAHWRLLIATVLILMGAAFVAPKWVRPPAIQENRILAPRPAWPKRAGELEAFRKAADTYVADRFPARPHLIGLLNRVRMLVGVSGSNRVIIGRDGWLFFDDDSHLGSVRADPPMDGPEIRSWLMVLAGRTEALRARGIPYLVVAAPVKEAVYPQFGPAWFKGPSETRATLLLPKLVREADVGEVLYLYPPIAEATRRGAKTYSRHDTHWTGYGAYAGYVAIMQKLHGMGLTEGPKPLSDFTMIPAGAGPQPRDLALMLGVASFVQIDFPHIDNPTAVGRMRTTYLGDKRDWTAPQVIDTGEVGKPVLLMTRDSFSNELLPMLLPHFSRIILAHNQDGSWRPDLIDRFKPDIVIMEVVEHGLRVLMGDGPTGSAEAASRIDHVLVTAKPAPGPATTPIEQGLAPPDARLLAAMSAAKLTPNCNLERSALTRGVGSEASLMVSGWLSELGPSITATVGTVRLQGPGIDLAAPIRVDLSRPDVAKVFGVATGEFSGFFHTYFIAHAPAGDYRATIYRQSPTGWIACPGREPLAVQ